MTIDSNPPDRQNGETMTKSTEAPVAELDRVDDLRKKLEAAEAAMAEMKRTSIPKVDPATLPKQEIIFEFQDPIRKSDQGMPVGGVIAKSTDAEWDRILHVNRPVFGSLVVNDLTYDEFGRVTERKCVACLSQKGPSIARAKMAQFEKDGTWWEVTK